MRAQASCASAGKLCERKQVARAQVNGVLVSSNSQLAAWSSGMILAQGARGLGLTSQSSPGAGSAGPIPRAALADLEGRETLPGAAGAGRI